MACRDLIWSFGVTLAALFSFYFSDFSTLHPSFLAAFLNYSLLLFVIGSVFLKSTRHGFKVTFAAMATVAFLSLIHLLSFASYDPLAPVAYFLTLLMSFLMNLYVFHGRFVKGEPLFKVYDDGKFMLTFLVVSTMLFGAIIASSDMMQQFGILITVGAALSYLIILFYLAPLARLEGKFRNLESLSYHEKRVHQFVKRYGKGKEVYPFFASWLGVAVSSVEDYIDRLEAKGFLGHNFFSVHNPFFWFISVVSYFLGTLYAKGSILLSTFPFLFLILGVAFVAPQSFLNKRTRRLGGLALLIATLVLFYLVGLPQLKIALFSILLAIVAIYFAYTDDELLSMVFASLFEGMLFVLAYSLWKPAYMITPEPWIISFVTFLLLVYEYYVRSPQFRF